MQAKPLQLFDFVRPDGKSTPGLIPVRDKSIRKQNRLRVDEKAVVLEAESFRRIDFVFFRRFERERSSQVSAYVVDNSDGQLDEASLIELHLQVWLQGKSPLLYVAWPGRVDVLACAGGPKFWDKRRNKLQYQPAKRFELDILRSAAAVSREMRRFSALRLADGTFWEDPANAELADHDNTAHQLLVQAVVEADRDIRGEKNPVLRRLLLLTVLIKYLEDRKVFPKDWFASYHEGARSFFDVLKGAQPEEVYRLLDFLQGKFNGDIFDLSRLPAGELTERALRRFADLVEAKTLKAQRYLWEQFSFNHLPVETISHLYQRFVARGHGAVYTPPFLAALLLDHAMPYGSLTGRERILDPACGSGIFLVGAFRRLVNVWRSHHDWRRPTVEDLKAILDNSIYGIDLDTSAIDLTAFSLSLAICDVLKPEVIWEKLTFDRLRSSHLFETDFFRFRLDAKGDSSPLYPKHFDLVIGNPPFESELSGAAMQIDQAAQQEESSRGSLPDKQVAYLFLEQALAILRPTTGRVCLIQPAGFLYNRNVSLFRTNIFQKSHVSTVLDFASIRALYEADTKTVAILADMSDPSSDYRIAHWTFRRTKSVQERICFELDYYDRHTVSLKQVKADPYLWRVNLLGGGRLLNISQHLRGMRTLAQYINQKGWDYGEGFIAGEKKPGNEKKETRKPAAFLTGSPYLPTKALTDSGIDENQIGTVKEALFESPRKETRFTPPLVLIKEKTSLPVVFWDRHFLAYRHRIVGIHSPPSQSSELRSFYKSFLQRQRIYEFCCALHGTESITNKATAVRKQDIDLLPFPENDSDLSFSFWEQVLCEDVLKYVAEYVRLGQESELLQKAADTEAVRDYSDTFLRMLRSIHGSLRRSDPIFLNGLICQPFYFGDSPDLSWLSEEDAANDLREIIYYRSNQHLEAVRVFRYYLENVILVVKPDRLRYWIRSTAIRDADETLVDLRDQGY